MTLFHSQMRRHMITVVSEINIQGKKATVQSAIVTSLNMKWSLVPPWGQVVELMLAC